MTAAFIALLDREISGSIGNKGDTLNYILKQIANGNQAPYKVYTALLTQSGTEAPTAVVLQNTLGELTFEYDNVGQYKIISNGLFTVGKTTISIGLVSNDVGFVSTSGGDNDENNLYINTADISGSALNNILNTSIEIRVYE